MNPFEAVRNFAPSQRLFPGVDTPSGRSRSGTVKGGTDSRSPDRMSVPLTRASKPCAILVLLALGLAAWASSRSGQELPQAQPEQLQADASRSLHGVQGSAGGQG